LGGVLGLFTFPVQFLWGHGPIPLYNCACKLDAVMKIILRILVCDRFYSLHDDSYPFSLNRGFLFNFSNFPRHLSIQQLYWRKPWLICRGFDESRHIRYQCFYDSIGVPWPGLCTGFKAGRFLETAKPALVPFIADPPYFGRNFG
jgi:hypothetical protein